MLAWRNRKAYLSLMRTDKPVGFFLLWWPVMWALWLAADGSPSISNVFIFSLGCFLMRSAGCVINDFADRKIDKHVERTKQRPLTSGQISSKEAVTLFFVLCALSFLLVLFTDKQTVLLSFVAVFLATLYPFTKRWLMFPQLFLGAAFSWGVVMAFSAEQAALDIKVWVLYLAVLLWTVAYDTFYAMVDQEDDVKIGVKSTAILFGENVQLITVSLQAAVLMILLYLSYAYQFSASYMGSLCIVLALFLYQQYLIASKNKENYFKAFLNNQWVGLVVFVGILLQYL